MLPCHFPCYSLPSLATAVRDPCPHQAPASIIHSHSPAHQLFMNLARSNSPTPARARVVTLSPCYLVTLSPCLPCYLVTLSLSMLLTPAIPSRKTRMNRKALLVTLLLCHLVTFYRLLILTLTLLPTCSSQSKVHHCHLVTLSPCYPVYLVTLLPCHLVTLLLCHLVTPLLHGSCPLPATLSYIQCTASRASKASTTSTTSTNLRP